MIYQTLYHYGKQAFQNLMVAKLRSFLAVLGILVGTAAVVALISSGELATEKALAEFKSLGIDLLGISVFPQAERSKHALSSLNAAFWERLPEKVPAVLKAAPYMTGYQPISFDGKPLNGAIVAAQDTLADIIKIQLRQGEFVSFVDAFERFCVIGDQLAAQIRILTFENPIGKQIRVGKNLFTIIGIAKPWKENAFFNENINSAAIIPLTAMALVNKEAEINNVVLLLRADIVIDNVINHIKQVIQMQAPNVNIFVRSAKQIVAGMESQGKIFTLLLAVIGGIALLVGGIGVMNVMLVSVSERRKEIGIRKAVGAKNSEIQLLFLVEAVLLSLLGGLLGVGVGLIVTKIVAYFSGWPFHFHLFPSFIGFVVSVFTGIFFGFYPARRAAALDPIVSLRSE